MVPPSPGERAVASSRLKISYRIIEPRQTKSVALEQCHNAENAIPEHQGWPDYPIRTEHISITKDVVSQSKLGGMDGDGGATSYGRNLPWPND